MICQTCFSVALAAHSGMPQMRHQHCFRKHQCRQQLLPILSVKDCSFKEVAQRKLISDEELVSSSKNLECMLDNLFKGHRAL